MSAQLEYLQSLASDLVTKAKSAGADAADAVVVGGESLSASRRLGKIEEIERSEVKDLGLRVFVGKRSAIVSSNDLRAQGVGPLVERALAMAKLAPEDPHAGLADPNRLATEFPDLDIEDAATVDADRLADLALEAEDAARAVEGVTNSNGATAGASTGMMVLATSEGFVGSNRGTRYSVSVSVVAANEDGMETDYDFSSTRFFGDLENPAEVGRRAGERAVKALSPKKVRTRKMPVVYDPRMARSLVGSVLGAISGAAVARGTSFLKDKMGRQVMASGLTVIDDPHRKRGLASKPFDAEGVANKRWALIEDGVLTTWLLDTATASKLGLETTGHAARGASSAPTPSTTNVHLEPGSLSPQELIADIKEGVYVTSLIGQGVNMVTGDYSRGAAGFWIENGEILYPVSEITVAGNLKDMFLAMTAADDLEFRAGTNAPTVRIEGMTVAGS